MAEFDPLRDIPVRRTEGVKAKRMISTGQSRQDYEAMLEVNRQVSRKHMEELSAQRAENDAMRAAADNAVKRRK